MRHFALALTLAIVACGGKPADERPPAQAPSSVAPAASTAPSAGSIPDSLLRLGGIRLGARMREVQELLGPSSLQDTSDARETLGYRFISWYYPRLTVEFADSSVAYLICSAGPECALAGVQLGTTQAEVERILGPGVASLGEPLPAGMMKYVGRQSDCGVTLEFSNERLTLIKLWCDYS